MANLYFVDEDKKSVKTIANTDSPVFIGEPKTNSRSTLNDRDILNVSDAVKYIDQQMEGFNETRIVAKMFNGTLSRLTGLIKGKKYMVSVSGEFKVGNYTSDYYDINPVTITDSSFNVLKASGETVSNVVYTKMVVPQSATLIIDKIPDNGIIYGFLNYDAANHTGTYATYMVAVRLS